MGDRRRDANARQQSARLWRRVIKLVAEMHGSRSCCKSACMPRANRLVLIEEAPKVRHYRAARPFDATILPDRTSFVPSCLCCRSADDRRDHWQNRRSPNTTAAGWVITDRQYWIPRECASTPAEPIQFARWEPSAR